MTHEDILGEPPQPVDDSLASMLSTCSTAHLWAEQDEGPYHRDAQPHRRDVTEDREGVGLQLGIRLASRDGTPPPPATVEIWHCDALGRYSGFPPPDDATADTAAGAHLGEYLADQTFLRGCQETDDAGMVEFRTIHPGWYPGRTVHIHVMVHLGDVSLTTQLYFPEDVNHRVLSVEPYASRPGRDTTNDTDEILPTGGEPALVDVTIAAGHRATIGLILPDGPAGQPDH